MIVTDEQRRWWFATHPEYSWSNTKGGGRGHGNEEGPAPGSPESVDAYVDEQLQYASGPLVTLLTSFKREFGTQGGLQERAEDQVVSPHGTENDWLKPVAYYPEGGGNTVGFPTLEELLRLPSEVTRNIIRSIDTWYRGQLFSIDPNALEEHHRLVKDLAQYFLDCGLNIEDYKRVLRAADHRLKPGGLHTGKGRGGDWNTEWKEFIKKYPAKNTRKHQERIREHLDNLEKKYGVDDKGYLLPPKPKRK